MNKLMMPMFIDAYQVRDGGVYLRQANDDKLKIFIKVYAISSVPPVDKLLKRMKIDNDTLKNTEVGH